jgi:HEAT repeat protein
LFAAFLLPVRGFPFDEPGQTAAQPSSVKLYEGRTLEEWRQAVKDLRPDDKTAVPGLIAVLKDQTVPWFTRRQMANTLGRMGKNAADAVPVLIQILEEPRTDEHSPAIWAAKSLALFGPEAREATPKLAAILKNPELPLAERQVALEALGQIGGAHPRAIPAVVETLNLPPRADSVKLQAERDSLRELAAESLAIVGKDAAVAVPVLLRCLNDPREPMRRKTIAALGKIGPAAQLGIPMLVESLAFDESPAVRDAAETALAGIGAPAIPALVHLLEDQEAELRLRAARGLGQMKAAAQPAAAKMRELLKDANPEVRLTAATALWQITQMAEASLPVLVGTLKSADRQLRMQAFRVLTTELGPAAIPARASLTELLKHEDPAVRQAAKKALERIPSLPESPSTPRK